MSPPYPLAPSLPRHYAFHTPSLPPRYVFLLYAKRIYLSPHRDEILQEVVHPPLLLPILGHQQAPLQLPRPIIPHPLTGRILHRQQARCLKGVPHRRRHATHAAAVVTPRVGGAFQVESVCNLSRFKTSEQAPKRVSVCRLHTRKGAIIGIAQY